MKIEFFTIDPALGHFEMTIDGKRFAWVQLTANSASTGTAPDTIKFQP